MPGRFYKCENGLCGKKYRGENLTRCPNCAGPLVVGIDIFDTLSENYEELDPS